jgi:hypothetical protein
MIEEEDDEGVSKIRVLYLKLSIISIRKRKSERKNNIFRVFAKMKGNQFCYT